MDKCTGHHDITEMLLKTVLNTIPPSPVLCGKGLTHYQMTKF